MASNESICHHFDVSRAHFLNFSSHRQTIFKPSRFLPRPTFEALLQIEAIDSNIRSKREAPGPTPRLHHNWFAKGPCNLRLLRQTLPHLSGLAIVHAWATRGDAARQGRASSSQLPRETTWTNEAVAAVAVLTAFSVTN